MKRKKQKGYWEKRKESFNDGSQAKSRARHLRSYEHIAHVTVERIRDRYVVNYSIAKWYLEQLSSSGGKL